MGEGKKTFPIKFIDLFDLKSYQNSDFFFYLFWSVKAFSMWKFSMRNEIRRVSVLFIMIQIYSVSFIIGIWMDIKSINLREIVTYKCYSNSSGIPCCSRLSLGHLELAENKYANMLVLLAFRNSYLKKKKRKSLDHSKACIIIN